MNTRPKFVTTYTAWEGDNVVFQGTFEAFQDMIQRKSGFVPKTVNQLEEWVRTYGYKLEKQFKRGRNIVTSVLFDPNNLEKIEFHTYQYGKKKGKRYAALKYTNSEGESYSFSLEYFRGTAWGKEAPQTRRREVTMRLLEKIYKAINGQEIESE
jgi:hypothetical protein